jgi:glycerol-3-phosphate dehydrogenase
MSRFQNIEKAKNEHFDVIIIGGGITGAGIYLRSCENGLKALLIDSADFASGTSSRSAKMIHGGLRYLQYMQIQLVKEALIERERLLRMYPHLVKPLPFVMPVYHSNFGLVKMKIGLTGYDQLANSSILPKHHGLSKNEMIQQYPLYKKEGLKGGYYYYDAITDDARLTNEVIMEADELGGTAINYLSAQSIEIKEGKINSILVNDELSGEKFTIKADHYISAAGIWTDDILEKVEHQKEKMMLPAKGIHLVMDGAHFPKTTALLIPCDDKRMLWICPWMDGLVIIGTTDTPYHGNLREPGATNQDVQYILTNLNNSLSGKQFSEVDILSIFSGLRPLIDEKNENDTVKVSRDYKIWWEKENLLMIAGGKFTSFLSMADNLLKELATRKEFNIQKRSNEQAPKSINKLTDKWGVHASKIEEIFNENSTNLDILLEGLNYQIADIIFYIRYQNAQKLSDVLTRRMTLTYRMKTINESIVEKVAAVMQKELDWTEAKKAQRIMDYTDHWKTLHPLTKS